MFVIGSRKSVWQLGINGDINLGGDRSPVSVDSDATIRGSSECNIITT